MTNNINKDAAIRENVTNICPFGLHIADGCKCAGKTVKKMTPLCDPKAQQITYTDLSDKDKKAIIDSNNRVMLLSDEQPAACIYAHYIFDDPNEPKVECSYGEEEASGVGVANINSPRNLSQYLGIGYYSVPLGFYNENLSFNDGFESYVNRYFADRKENFIVKLDIKNNK